MTSFHAKRQGQQQEALALLQKNQVRLDVLLSSAPLGMTSQSWAEFQANAGYRPVYAALEWLSSPGSHLLPFLAPAPIRLAGRTGRPPTGYLLTEFGAEVFNLLDPERRLQAPNLRDVADLHHRFCELEILTHARQAHMEAEAEVLLPYGKGYQSVRGDVVVTQGQEKWFLEVEQELPRNNLPRAVAKFEHWQRYAQAHLGQLRLVLVFNLADLEEGATVANWQEARARAETTLGNLPYEVTYLPLSSLLTGPFLEALTAHTVPLEASEPQDSTPHEAISVESRATQPQEIPVWVRPFFGDYLTHVHAFEQASEPETRFYAFFALMGIIYQASFFPESPSILYSVHPREALWLLRHYLTLPQNQPMYGELREGLAWIQKRSGQMGLIMFRDAMSRMLWDVFMRHHGFSRGGNLGIIFQIPDFQDNRSDYWVEIRSYADRHLKIPSYRFDDLKVGLSWVLSSLFIYIEELGLGKPLWRQATAKAQKGSKGKKK